MINHGNFFFSTFFDHPLLFPLFLEVCSDKTTLEVVVTLYYHICHLICIFLQDLFFNFIWSGAVLGSRYLFSPALGSRLRLHPRKVYLLLSIYFFIGSGSQLKGLAPGYYLFQTFYTPFDSTYSCEKKTKKWYYKKVNKSKFYTNHCKTIQEMNPEQFEGMSCEKTFSKIKCHVYGHSKIVVTREK